MNFKDDVLRAVGVRINRILDERAGPVALKGTVTSRPSSTEALVTFDGSSVAVPVRVSGDVRAAEGDRVGLVKFDGRWVIVATFTDPAWRPYTPVWTSTGTQPTIGNGFKSGAYCRFGKIAMVRGKLVMKSTTTFGTGSWRVSVPVPRTTADDGVHPVGSLFLYDATGPPHGGFTGMINPTTLWLMYAGGGDITPTNPQTWAVDDELHWFVVYEAA